MFGYHAVVVGNGPARCMLYGLGQGFEMADYDIDCRPAVISLSLSLDVASLPDYCFSFLLFTVINELSYSRAVLSNGLVLIDCHAWEWVITFFDSWTRPVMYLAVGDNMI